MHLTSKRTILYFGMPVALLSTINVDGSANLAFMSSTISLSWRCVLGLQGNSKTVENLRRTGELVINMASVEQAAAVDRLAKTTGIFPIPPDKAARDFRHEARKFEPAGLTPMASELVAPPRIRECRLNESGPLDGFLTTFEMLIRRIHVENSILVDGHDHRIDPNKWRPLMFSFQQFYGLGDQVHASTLGQIPEALYLTPDMILSDIHPVKHLGAD